MSMSLVKRNDIRVSLHNIEEEIFVAHFREPGFLFLLIYSFHIVNFGFLNADNVLLSPSRHRSSREKFRPFCRRTLPTIAPRRVRDQSLGSKRFLIEEVAKSHTGGPVIVRILLLECRGINSQLGKQSARFFAVRKRRLDGDSSPVGQQHPPTDMEFVSLGMSAKVVVIVQNQD